MSTDGHEVNVVLIDIDGDLANGLGCVCVEEDLTLSAHLAYLLGGLNDTYSRAETVKGEGKGKTSMQFECFTDKGLNDTYTRAKAVRVRGKGNMSLH